MVFRLEETESDTHTKLKCKSCLNKIPIKNPSDEADCSSDLSQWYHCWDKKGLADMVFELILLENSSIDVIIVLLIGFETNLGCVPVHFVRFPSEIRQARD